MKRFAVNLIVFLVAIINFCRANETKTPLNDATGLASDAKFDFIGRTMKNTERYISCVLIDQKFAIAGASGFLSILNGSSGDSNPDYLIDNLKQIKLIFGRDTVKIKKYKVHPFYSQSYDNKSDDYGQYNIVLLELERPIQSVVPATLCRDRNELNRKALDVNIKRKIIRTNEGVIDSVSRTGQFVNIAGLLGGVEKGKEPILVVYTDPVDFRKLPPMSDEEVEINRKYNLKIESGLFTENSSSWELTGLLIMTKHFVGFGNPNAQAGSESQKNELRFVRISSLVDWINKEISGNKKLHEK